MQSRTSVVNFHKYTSDRKTLLDRDQSTFDKGTRLIKITPFLGSFKQRNVNNRLFHKETNKDG